ELERDEFEVALQFTRAETVPIGQPGEDVRDLRDREVAVDEIGRGEGPDAAARLEVAHQRFGALFAGHVAVCDTRGLQRQSHEFSAPRYAWPIPERVGHQLSPGAEARTATAWTRWPGISPSAALTMRWRSSRLLPANAALSIRIVKCDSPLPSSPAWPWCLALSFITSSRDGANAEVSSDSISDCNVPAMGQVWGFPSGLSMPILMGVKQTKFHGRYEGTGRRCETPGCNEAGEFRAP